MQQASLPCSVSGQTLLSVFLSIQQTLFLSIQQWLWPILSQEQYCTKMKMQWSLPSRVPGPAGQTQTPRNRNDGWV